MIHSKLEYILMAELILISKLFENLNEALSIENASVDPVAQESYIN